MIDSIKMLSCLYLLLLLLHLVNLVQAFKYSPPSYPSKWIRRISIDHTSYNHKSARGPIAMSSSSNSHASYLQERNELLLTQILNATSTTPTSQTNFTEAILPWMNFYDDSFDAYLSQQISDSAEKGRKDLYGKIRYEINTQRQQQLLQAQKLFKSIISMSTVQEMEAQLLYYLSRNEIQLPFQLILEMNLENAMVNEGSEAIIQLLTHLRSIIYDYQDTLVSKPVKLLRQVLRLDESEERKALLRQKIVTLASSSSPSSQSPTSSEQCEFIVTSASLKKDDQVADVTLAEFEDAIKAVEQQLEELLQRALEGGGSQEEIDSAQDIQNRCQTIRQEIREIAPTGGL